VRLDPGLLLVLLLVLAAVVVWLAVLANLGLLLGFKLTILAADSPEGFTVAEDVVLHRVRLNYEALADGKGVVIALPHTGNWDVGGRALWR